MATATRTLRESRRAQTDTKRSAVEIGKSTFKEFMQDDCMGLAAESAYHILFSIFPLAIFAASMSAIVNSIFGLDLFNRIMTSLTSVLPSTASSAIADPLKQVLQNQNGGLLSVGLILALFSGSNAMSTFIKALNRSYDVEETRPFWRIKLLQILLTLFMGVLVTAAFVLIVFGGKIINSFAKHLGAGHLFTVVWNLARWPIVVVFIMFALAVLYWVGPNVKQEFKWLSPGAILATVVWLVAISGFGIYVSRFGSYNKTYGTLGGVIVLMLVFYISSAIVLLGGELNSELGKRFDPETIDDIAAHPEKDKGETIYADKAPKKEQHERETDLKGAMARGDDPNGPPAAPTARVETGGRTMRMRQTDAGNLSMSASARTSSRMPPNPSATGERSSSQSPPTKRAAIGVGLMSISAIGLAAKKLLGK